MQNHSKMHPKIRSGPEAPGRDGVSGKVALVLFVFLSVGRLSSEVSSFSGRPASLLASFFGLRKRTCFRRFFKVVLGRFFIGFKGLLGSHFGSFFHCFFDEKIDYILGSIFGSLWEGFWDA